MSNYKLYGTELIINEKTLKEFAQSVYDLCPLKVFMENGEDRKDFIMDCVEEILNDDISRTKIDYEGLLYKYRDELGDLFYRMWDHDIYILQPEFIGEKAITFFNDCVYYYILLHYDEFEAGVNKEINYSQSTEQLKQYYVSYSGGHIVEAEDEDEACQVAMEELSIEESSAYEMNEDGSFG